jgi:hypothetical protein
VQLNARDTIRLGRAGAGTIVTASEGLTIDARTGDVATLGDVALTGGSGVTQILAGDDIVAPGLAVTAAGGLDLRFADDVVLKAVNAPMIRTLDAELLPVNASGITATGLIDVGAITTKGDLLLDGAESVKIGQATAGGIAIKAGAGGLTADRIVASGKAALTSAGDVTVTTDIAAGAGVSASGQNITINGQGNIAFTAIDSANALTVKALGKVTADTIEAAFIDLAAAQGLTLESVSSSGTIKLAAANGAVTATGSSPNATFQATGKSVSLTGLNGLTASVTATDGNVSLTTVAGGISGGGTATGDFAYASAAGVNAGGVTAGSALRIKAEGAVTFEALTASGALAIDAKKDVTGGSATGASVAITTPGALVADNLIATAGTLSAIADTGVSLDTAASTGTATLKAAQGLIKVASNLRPGEGLVIEAPTIDLTAQNGLNVVQAVTTAGDLKLTSVAGDLTAGTLSSKGGIALAAQAGRISVTNDISASGPIQATAQALSLTALNDLVVAQAQATGGDILLASKNGALTIGEASATGALTANTPGLLTVIGSANGAAIAFTSKDIAIGSGAQLGSKALTAALTLTSIGDRMFVGEATGSGYRLDTGELARLASKGDISLISTPQNATGQAFTLIDPAATNVVIGALTFDGAQLGPNGTLRIASPRSVGITGNAQFKNFGGGQTVTIDALADISLAAETGLVTLKDSAGALAGTLRLQARQVHAMSTATRTDVAGLTLNQAQQRLGTNDQVNNQGGYFQAGNIVVRIGQSLLVQNSGENGADPALRRGLTANNLTIFAGEGAPPQIVLNGRVNGATGGDLRSNVTLNGSFDPASAFNGCAIGAVCGLPPVEPPPFEPVPDPVISSSRDQVRSLKEEDEKEEALQASQTRPEPVIQFMTVPASRSDPLIDEPVTGAGNEDFWEAPLAPSPGR